MQNLKTAIYDAIRKIDNVEIEPHTGRVVVINNDSSTAERLKRIDPYTPVFLFNPDTKEYKQYKIKIVHKSQSMKNGQLIEEKEIIEM